MLSALESALGFAKPSVTAVAGFPKAFIARVPDGLNIVLKVFMPWIGVTGADSNKLTHIHEQCLTQLKVDFTVVSL